MLYQVLARRCRPQTFADVIGQKHVTQTLTNAIQQERIAHAYLFSGERGVGKTSVARILAKALNCLQGPTAQPCNQCPSCREITASGSIDVHEIDGASNTSVDDVRTLRENVRYLPSRDRYKIYIIDEVHMLSKPAFNALLKTLEEPPPHVIFMFATTEPEKIPDTILSRCLRFDFKRIPTKDIISHLETIVGNEHIRISSRGLFLIARASEGSMRDAQSLLDRILSYGRDEVRDEDVEELLGRVDRGFLYRITEALLSEDAQACIASLNTMYESGVDIRQFYYAYLEHLRDLMLAKVSSHPETWMDVPEEDLKEVVRLSSLATADELKRYVRVWFSLEEEINRSALPKIALEMCFLEMVTIKETLPLDEALKKLDELQKKIEGGGGTPGTALFTPGHKPPAMVREEQGRGFYSTRPAAAQGSEGSTSMASAGAEGDQDACGFLDFIRQKNLPLASQLEHGKITVRANNEIIIELPADSFFLENLRDSETEKKIRSLCEEFFKRKMGITVVASEKKTIASGSENKKDQEQKKRKQEALHNPIVQKIIDAFDGEIIDVKTDV
ncbi:MAG: DNA polymerase III subunit gamma/tau [Proteobacteria bacterium]|nr:DNA polymerase III subunit gamma/tau [Pseudomonadota bacterium]